MILLELKLLDKATFKTVPHCINKVRAIRGNDTIIFIIGNKRDIQDRRQVTEDEGQNLAKEHNAIHFEVSAKAGENVNNIFNKIATVLPGIEPLLIETSSQNSKPSPQTRNNNIALLTYQSKVNWGNPAYLLNQNVGRKGCCSEI